MLLNLSGDLLSFAWTAACGVGADWAALGAPTFLGEVLEPQSGSAWAPYERVSYGASVRGVGSPAAVQQSNRPAWGRRTWTIDGKNQLSASGQRHGSILRGGKSLL